MSGWVFCFTLFITTLVMSAVSLITRKTAVVAILLVIVVLFAELKFGRLDEVFPLIVGLLLAGNIIYYWFKKRSS